MKLLVKADDGVDFVVTEEIQDYDLDKSVAAAQLLLDLKNTFKQIENRPQYEVVDMTPGLKLPGGREVYDVALERKHYWMGKCVELLDEATVHNCCPDGGANAVSKAQTWQDRVIRILSGRGIAKFTVDKSGLIPYLTVLYEDGVTEIWCD